LIIVLSGERNGDDLNGDDRRGEITNGDDRIGEERKGEAPSCLIFYSCILLLLY